ncbi:MAG: AAA family ATPase [Bacteroidales bacterium]|jgi:dephospho-CoA kinase|nr:AAA family ATPase [Bacteroidales bacterium]
MIILGITGTIGAGKGTIVDYLVQKFRFQHYSVREYLATEATKRGMALNRDTYVALANELRLQHSPSFIIDQLYEEAIHKGENAIIESIRTVGEIESLRQKESFVLLAIDAQKEIRYHRIIERQSETDHIDFDTFKENEAREMSATDPHKQNLSQCIAQADFLLNNDGDFPQLYQQIDGILEQIDKSHYK